MVVFTMQAVNQSNSIMHREHQMYKAYSSGISRATSSSDCTPAANPIFWLTVCTWQMELQYDNRPLQRLTLAQIKPMVCSDKSTCNTGGGGSTFEGDLSAVLLFHAAKRESVYRR